MPHSHFSLTATQTDQLKNHLRQLLNLYPIESQYGPQIEKTLLAHYSEPHRHYHNRHHIFSLLQLAQHYQSLVQDFNTMQWAIWFHDVIYDPKRHDNEKQSAQLAIQSLQELKIDQSTITSVEAMILMTATHDGQQLSSDMQIFSDLDLVILGASKMHYQAYAQAIRQEYHWVSDQEYQQGRGQILKHLIQRPHIYLNAVIRRDYEQTARNNIAWELNQL